MENVERSLKQVSQTLEQLVQINGKGQQSSKQPSASFISSKASTVSNLPEGYKGDSSFKAHVQRVTDALRDAGSSLDLSVDSAFHETISATQKIQEAADGEKNSPGADTFQFTQIQYPELEGRTLPPLDQVLKLLRLTQVEKQRLFLDIPVLDEKEFADLCQSVYFSINGYSITAWATVNAGLFYLFFGLKEQYFAQVGVTSDVVKAHMQLLTSNIEAAIESLRLCQEPSAEACQAFACLVGRYTGPGTFCANSSGGLLHQVWEDFCGLVDCISRFEDVC